MPFLSHATVQGGRSEQQDRYVVANIPEPGAGILLAVMDGHGGQAAAQLIAAGLQPIFTRTRQSHPKDIPLTLQETVQRLAAETTKEDSGSTLTIVFIPEDQKHAHAAILGDSPVMIIDAHGEARFGPLHNARTDPLERKAAEARGARYVGGYLEDPYIPGEGVQLSRALGDRKLTRILNREPEVFSVSLGPSSLVVLATDGILSSFEHDVEGQLRRTVDLARKADAEEIVQDALKRGTGDNVTVVIWRRTS